MGRHVGLHSREADAIRAELKPVVLRLRAIAAEHRVSLHTILKYVQLPETIPVRAVKTDAIPGWNERIAGQ